MITEFNGIDHYGQPLASENLETSLTFFAQWAMLNIGAFSNNRINNNPSGIASHSADPSRLRMARDPRYASGRVWEGVRSDWVWETGISYTNQPINISGVYVNNNFIPVSQTGASGYKISYPEGKIIFNSPIASGSKVQCEYSNRSVKILKGNQPWFNQLVFNSYNAADPQFLQNGSGTWDVLSQNRVQLPAMIIEAMPKVNFYPLELGNLSRKHQQEVIITILSETSYDRNQIHDIVTYQWQKRIMGVDRYKLVNDKKYPLNYDGSVSSSGIQYPAMVSGDYAWKQIRFENVKSREVLLPYPLVGCEIRLTCESDLP